MLRLLATKRTNLPFLAPLSTAATVKVTVFGVVSVVAGAFSDLVFVDVVMMTFLSVWTLFLFFYLFCYFPSWGLRTTQAWGRKHREKSVDSYPLILVDCREPVLCVVIVLLVARRGYIIVMVLTMSVIAL